MSFDEDLFQPHAENRSDYYNKKEKLIASGFSIISPVYPLWNGDIRDVKSIMRSAGADTEFIILNIWDDVQFFFKNEESYSFFLLKFSDYIKGDLGYLR